MPQNNIVSFNSILVNSMIVDTGIFVGTNSQGNWSVNNNNKFGFGIVLGTNNIISRAVNIFMDNDVIDTPIISNSYNGSIPSALKKGEDNITIYGCCRTKKKKH